MAEILETNQVLVIALGVLILFSVARLWQLTRG